METHNSKKNTKDQRLEIRLSAYDLEKLKRKASAMDLSNSELIRRLVKYGVCYKIDFNSIDEILYQLSKIGTNINQITRGINTAVIKGEEIDADQMMETLNNYYNSLKALQLTCEQYFKDNSIKQLKKITIDD